MFYIFVASATAQASALFYLKGEQGPRGNSPYPIEIFSQGSNMIVSALMRLIEEFYEDHGFLPRILHVNCDNCARENKERRL